MGFFFSLSKSRPPRSKLDSIKNFLYIAKKILPKDQVTQKNRKAAAAAVAVAEVAAVIKTEYWKTKKKTKTPEKNIISRQQDF